MKIRHRNYAKLHFNPSRPVICRRVLNIEGVKYNPGDLLPWREFKSVKDAEYYAYRLFVRGKAIHPSDPKDDAKYIHTGPTPKEITDGLKNPKAVENLKWQSLRSVAEYLKVDTTGKRNELEPRVVAKLFPTESATTAKPRIVPDTKET